MRPIWNGMLTFGLVNIPVGLYPATEDSEIHMHLLHKEDNGRIKNQRVCSVDGKPVDYDDLVKGYEYEKGHFVTLTDEDFEKVRVEATDRIVIDDFVESSEIDPKYFEKPYYLLPGKKSDAPYALLREALKKSGKVGVARIVIRTRERLAAIRVDGAAIMLDTMHFSDELRNVDGLPSEKTVIGVRELEMANMLINAMTTSFKPEKYHDTYTSALHEMIDEKVKGHQLAQPEERSKPTDVIDLMKYLKASIEKAGKADDKGKTTKAETSTDQQSSTATAPTRRRKKTANA